MGGAALICPVAVVTPITDSVHDSATVVDFLFVPLPWLSRRSQTSAGADRSARECAGSILFPW
jgi:hypothetical protein